MNIIGITGASGSGKTYFSKQLGKSLEDSSIINLDYTFFEILNTDSEIREQIINLYGEKAYDRSGYINISELQNMKEFKFENFFNIIKDKLDNKILQIINENKSKNIQNLVIEWFLLPKTIAFQMSDYSILISPSEKDREKSLLKRDENETTEKIKKRTEAIPIDYNDYNYDKISINTYQKGCYDKDIEEIVKQQENVRRKEPVTNFGNVDIEFDTNKIFLLFQILYRIESLEDKINSNNSEISYLSDSIKEFKEIIEKNRQGLMEFNTYKENAENNDMWAEYGEYITSFAQTDIEELQFKNPAMAETVRKLINTDFFTEVEKINKQYSNEMEKRFIEQTENYKKQAENIVGKTNVKKIIYMPFSPKLFNIEPCCLSDKNGNKEYAVQFTIPTDEKEFEEMFGMEYAEGIESVILFHEKLHADIPTKSKENFINPMQREIDSHLKHTIIELLANGEMGVDIANNSNYFQGTFHTGKIAYNDKVLTTNELQNLGMKDNELLHTQATESYGDIVEHFSKEEMGIIKIRGMMYPYALMYNNRNDEHQLEKVMQEVLRDSQMLKEIYGTDFAEKMQDVNFLKQVQKSVKPYDNILEFAEGMSKELLGIEQVKEFGETEIGKATVNTPTENKDRAKAQIQRDVQILQQTQENRR